MPKKHKRSKAEDDGLTADLPPSEVAKPLSVAKGAKSNGIFSSDSAPARKPNKRKRKDDADDTPKAFQRLMMFQQGKRLRSGLDDGIKPTKKQKQAAAAAEKGDTPQAPKVDPEQVEIPKIKPGEKMSEFAARVDAALPISGLINKTGKNGKDPLGLKVGRTKTEKRMHRMYAEWREQEQKIQDKRQEAMELAEEEELDDEGRVKWKVDPEDAVQPGKKKNGKGKKKKAIGEIDDGNDDPWAILKKTRNEGPNRLSDVYQAPPTFTKIPKEKFKVRGARVEVEDVPKASGSLRRREELGEVRQSVVEGTLFNVAKNGRKPLCKMENSEGDDFEGLIDFLVQELAINDWNKGLSVSELLGRIETFYDTLEQTKLDIKLEDVADENGEKSLIPAPEPEAWERPLIDRNFQVRVWDTLVARDDIIVGEGSVLSLDEAEALPIKGEADDAVDSSIDPALLLEPSSEAETGAPAIEYQPRIHVGQRRLWLVLTGHDVDKTKLPFSEWQLLLAIAAAGKKGILQAEARNTTGQDKRSVPRRTDFLAQKGYIEKKQVLAFNQKTSLLTHKIFLEAKSVQRDIVDPSKLPASTLTQDLKPVPGHEHWSGLFVDIEMVARTAVAIMRAWGVIRRTHILAKMNINDLRLRKTLERIMRKLFELKVCKRVSALLPNNPKIFKDCIKFLRDPTEDEWSHFKKRLTSQGFKNRPSRAKPKSEHKPRVRKRAKGKANKYTVDDLSEDAFDDAEAEESGESDGDFFDGEDEEVYDASEKPALMTTKESAEDIIEQVIETNPGDEGISEEDLLSEADTVSNEDLLALFTPFDISSAAPSDKQTIRVVREPIKKSGRDIYQYYLMSSFERRVNSGESSWDGAFVLRRPGAGSGQVPGASDYSTVAPQPVASLPALANSDTPHTKNRSTTTAVISQKGDGSSKQTKVRQPSTLVKGPSTTMPPSTTSKPQPETPKRPRGRPRKSETDSKAVKYTSNDQLQREAGIPGAYFDLPDFPVQEKIRGPSGLLPRGRKPKRMMMMIKSEKLKSLNLAPKPSKPQDFRSVEVEDRVSQVPEAAEHDKVEDQGASTMTMSNVDAQDNVEATEEHLVNSSRQGTTSTPATYTSPYPNVPTTPSIPRLASLNNQTQVAVSNAPRMPGSAQPSSTYVSPYVSGKPQGYSSPYAKSPETTKIPAPQPQRKDIPAPKTVQLGREPCASQYKSPYATIEEPAGAYNPVSPEARVSPVLQSSSISQSAQSKPYKSPYAAAIRSPSPPSKEVSPAGSDQQAFASSQLEAEIRAAARGTSTDDHEAVLLNGGTGITRPEAEIKDAAPEAAADTNESVLPAEDMDTTNIPTSRDDADDLIHISVSKNGVAGNLCLNDIETQLEFLPLDTEDLASKWTIELSQISAFPIVDTETCEVVIVIKEAKEETQETEDQEFRFPVDPTLTDAATIFVAKVGTAMRRKKPKNKKTPLPHWAFPVPDGGPKPFKCDQCEGAWKNYEGVKYHKTKAKVSCNPNWTRPPTPPPPPPPEEKKKRSRESFERGELSPEDAARASAQRDRDGGWSIHDDGGRPKRRQYRRRQTIEPEALKELANPEEPGTPSTPSHRVGTPVPADAAVVGATDESPSKVATPEKRAMLAARMKLKYPTANDRDNIERRTGPVITQKRKEVIMDLLEAYGGAFPGDQGLWFAMHAAWMQKYPDSLIQDYKYCNQAVGLLEDGGLVTKVKFSFRDQTGRMRTRAVVTKKGVDPLSPLVNSIKANIKEVFPKYYCPPDFEPPEAVLSMLEARESRPSEEERQRRMLAKEREEDPKVRAQKEAEALKEARILSRIVEAQKETANAGGPESDDENEVVLLSAPFYVPDPDADGETDVEYGHYIGRRRKRRNNGPNHRRTNSFREGQSSRMKALWASLKAQGVTLKDRRLNGDVAGEVMDESDSDFMLSDAEIEKPPLTTEEQKQADYAHLHGWQTASSFLQNTDGSWGKAPPKHIQAKIHIRRSVLPEPVTYMQTANNPSWSYRPFGHGVNAIHVMSANRVAVQKQLQFPHNRFRPVIVHKSKRKARIGPSRDRLVGQPFGSDAVASWNHGRGSNFSGGVTPKKPKSLRWDEESDDLRPYGLTATGEEMPWPDFKPLPLPDSRLRTKPVMPEWSNNPGLDSLILQAPSFSLPSRSPAERTGTPDDISAAAADAGVGAASKGLFSRSTASFKDMLPKSLESIISQMNAKGFELDTTEGSAYTNFMSKIITTEEWEQTIGGRTLLGMGNIAPGDIYINHTAEELRGRQTTEPAAISWLADNSFTLETLPYELLVVDPVQQLLSTSIKSKPRRGYQKRQRTENAASFFGMVEATKSDFDYLTRKRKLPGSQLIGQPRQKRPYRRAAQSKDFRVRRHTSLPIDIQGLDIPLNDPDFEVSISYHGISGHRKRTNERTVISEALDDRLIVAVVVIRTLTGGLDQSVDWVLVSRLFPQCTMNWVRRHFNVLAEKHAKRLAKMTEDFQTAYLAAYDSGELSKLDYDHLLDYDWDLLIDWAMKRTQLVRTATVDLPSTRERFDEMYELQDVEEKNWRDSYFSSTLPVHKRIAHASASNLTLPASPPLETPLSPQGDMVRIARSWARASTLTPADSFNPVTASTKLRGLGPEVMRDAITQLVEAKVIMPVNKGRPAPGRGFEATDVLTAALSRILTQAHYSEAVAYKERLDEAFKKDEIVMLEYTASEGEILATTNMQSAQRIVQTGHRIPMNKFGLTEGNYQTKKMDKTKLLFDIQISPLDTYVYDDAHPLIRSNMLSIEHNPPPKPHDGALPLWYDINDQLIPGLWRKVMGAVLATIMQRPGIEAKEVTRLLSPALEEWEARLAVEWAFGVDALKEVAPGTGIEGWTVGEWWWWVAGKI
ncbi:hypothetical protein V495_06777 [Pseudogymnoascus sp. VKM F-4514 (FW-929)]|nr:hypothetical protein V495_06777 [Pseudogymnoascus sp. VKM F-4514 (FW-929)]KFY62689.1 hypothetical protein V497_02279 [Pseudogymnoascus sp. VKM F-4516 (FW-969)]